MYVHPLAIATQPPSFLYMVCDGHSGSDAANFVAANFLRVLNAKLPARPPSALASPSELESFAEMVRRAVCETFVRMDNDWIAAGHMAGVQSRMPNAGTTVTAAIVIGHLLTVANVGDSSAVLDTGCSILELTGSHRIQTSQEEQARLRGAGCQLAPLGFHLQGPARPNELGVGPLRLWPGGLCVGRSVGDLDAGPEVVPLPHIRQVILPTDGSRLIVASDGVWDLMSLSKAVKLCRLKNALSASSVLMATVSRDLRLLDDASIIVVDLLPSDSSSFPTIALKSNPKPEKSGGLFACFKPELDEPDSRDLNGLPGHLTFLADIDSLKAYPQLRGMLQRGQIQFMASVMSGPATGGRPGVDFTMHGANKVSLYKGFSEGGSPRSGNSSSAIADVAMDMGMGTTHGHSSHSVDSLPQRGGTRSGPVGAEDDDDDTPVMAFGSAPQGRGATLANA